MRNTERNIQQRIQDMYADRTQGASELAREGLDIAADAAYQLSATNALALVTALQSLAHDIMITRTSMTPVYKLLHAWSEQLEELTDIDLPTARQTAQNMAYDLVNQSLRFTQQLVQAAYYFIGENKTLFTHSLSSTLISIAEQLVDKNINFIITESRPLNEGVILAEKLSKLAIPTTLITEAQLGLFIKHADLVFVGADSILPDYSVVNKAETYLLALAAKAQNIPFYVCCESFKLRDENMPHIALEEMAASETCRETWDNVTIKNIYFDITPPNLVTAWINENGVNPVPPN